MKIETIKINGFKKLVQFSIDPDGKSVEIMGRNGQGKSSIIDAIWVTLTGQEVPGVPVNKDSIKAKIVVGLDSGHTAALEFGKSGKKLIVEGPDGEPVKAPATFLANLIGKISFDPFAFVELPAAKQKAFLQDLLKLDFSDLDIRKTKELAEKRDAEQDARSIEKQLETLVSVTESQAVDVSALVSAQEERQAQVRRLDAAQVEIGNIERQIEDSKARHAVTLARIEAAKAEVARLTELLDDEALIEATAIERLSKGSVAVAQMVATLDATPDNSQAIRDASETNRHAEAWKRKVELRKEYAVVEASIATAKQKLEDIENDRKERLFAAPFPVKGLEFTEEGVLFNGLPFDRGNQCQSDILRVGVAIAVAQDPALKIVRIKDGSLLDTARKTELLAQLSQAGFQAFLETVADTELQALTIEESAVAQKPAAEDQLSLL